MVVSDSVFEGNTASRNGAGMFLDCAAEICVGELPRDSCDAVAANISGTGFANNTAVGDGGGIHVSNRDLGMATAGTFFDGNAADRGAAVFSIAGGSVFVDGATGAGARGALVAVAYDSNAAIAYGAVLASPPSSLSWVNPPVAGLMMPGDNLCAGGSGCLASMGDDYGNVPTTPTVVHVAVSGSILSGPQFVLVAGGFSEVIPDLSVRLVGDPTSGVLPAIDSIVTVGLRFVDEATYYGAVSMTAAQCGAGSGMMTGDGTVWCEPCVSGSFSDAVAWAPCQPCAGGYMTEPGTTGAEACDWCVPGYGWDGAGSCVACETGTFSSEATFEIGCNPCDSGLTTSGDGASACAIVTNEGSTPWWVWLLIGVAVSIVVAIVAVVAWRSSRRKVISHYYIGMSLAGSTFWEKGGGGRVWESVWAYACVLPFLLLSRCASMWGMCICFGESEDVFGFVGRKEHTRLSLMWAGTTTLLKSGQVPEVLFCFFKMADWCRWQPPQTRMRR